MRSTYHKRGYRSIPEGPAPVVATGRSSRRATRMEMHQAMLRERLVTHEHLPGDSPSDDRNLLAGGVLALDNLTGVYRALALTTSPESGAYEVNFTDEIL